MTLFKVTISEQPEPYFVEASNTDEAIDEVKLLVGLSEITGDIEEIVQ